METAVGMAVEAGGSCAGTPHGSEITYKPGGMSFALVFSIWSE